MVVSRSAIISRVPIGRRPNVSPKHCRRAASVSLGPHGTRFRPPSSPLQAFTCFFFTRSAKKLDDGVFINSIIITISLLLYYIVHAYRKNSVYRSLSKVTMTAVVGGVAFLFSLLKIRFIAYSYYIRQYSSFRIIRVAPSYL